MPRLVILALALSSIAYLPARGGEEKGELLEKALAYQKIIQDVIRQAEPSVACVLVTRSDVYQREYGDSPPEDDPGKLGDFNPDDHRGNARIEPMQPFHRFRNFRRAQENPHRKYHLGDPDYVPEIYGSGLVIDGAEKLVLTAYHVVRDATKIYVRLPGTKGSYANIHAADPRSDLAVLRLIERGQGPLQAVKFGDAARLEKGQSVIVLANPFAAGFSDGSPSASVGIISNLRRRAAAVPRDEDNRAYYLYNTLLQTDAKMNAGCSGGGMFNLQGELIGLTSSRTPLPGGESPGGFAIPIDEAMRRIIEKLRKGEEVEYGFLGLDVRSHANGVRVNGSPPVGSPAHHAGLQEGDVIESINGVTLHDERELYLLVSSLPAGSEVRLAVENRSQLVTVTLAKHFVSGKIFASKKPQPVRGIRVDYASVHWMRYSQQNVQFWPRRSEIQPGVFVTEIQPNSRAAEHLRVNDIITQIKVKGVNVRVMTPAEFYREAARVPPNEPLDLTLVQSDHRQTTTTRVTVP